MRTDRNIFVPKTLSFKESDRDVPRLLMSACRARSGEGMGALRVPARALLAGLSLLSLLLAACQTSGGKDTIAKLRTVEIEIKEEQIEGGLEKAMESYRRFLEQTPDSALSPEAIRRLADLKVEKEYGLLSGGAPEPRVPAAGLSAPAGAAGHPVAGGPTGFAAGKDRASDRELQAQAEFEKQATRSAPAPRTEEGVAISLPGAENLERAGAREAIALYQKLLTQFPLYGHNDQVLYQMSRAYEELGQVDDAMQVMNRLVREYPGSRYMDEVQFRRAEYFFTRRRYFDAEDAYSSIVTRGVSSSYYQLALYKLGWAFYKQELYDEALHRFIALLDHKVSVGYDFAQTADEAEHKRMDDTFRVISLSFSNLGGANSVVEYFARHGTRTYEDGIYGNLGEFYFDKRRYSDAAATYNAFVSRNPFHTAAPQFHMKVIEVHIAGAFPSLVIEAKKQFASTYGVKAEYWRHFEQGSRPEVLGWLKTNLTDLAKHYHALYQSPKQIKEKKTNFEEALHWYREFLISFPADPESPSVNFMLADLFLENGSFGRAAAEYEKTAYEYPLHEKSAQAGYAAVYAYRQHLAGAAPEEKEEVKREIVRSSLKFADAYPEHEKAAIVLAAAADDLYDMKEYEPAAAAARKLIAVFPGADRDVIRAAWLVVGHATYELHHYSQAEAAYANVLAMLPAADTGRDAVVDNLAAAIYKQGEQANAEADHRAAAGHFLRVGRLAPGSKIRVNAEYDAAAALMQLKDWKAAATVLTGFRDLFPGHALQPEVTKKIAFVYREDKQLASAAEEYERIERESKDEETRREALLTAAELHEQIGDSARTLSIYRRYVQYFPNPAEPNLETRSRIAELLKKNNDRDGYLAELRQMVAIDAGAGSERTPRTRSIAGKAGLVLAEQTFEQFTAVKLIEPFEANLSRKKELMKVSTQQFTKLLDYEVGDVTAGATYYLAEIYADFSRDLKGSERPTGLSALEREEYDLAIEEQAYPFEDKAIAMHKSNLDLISLGVYNEWVDKSLHKLAKFVPARYDKPEEDSPVIASLDVYVYAIERPDPAALQVGEKKQEGKPAEVQEAVKTEEQAAKPDEVKEAAKPPEPQLNRKPHEASNALSTAKPKHSAKSGGTPKAAKAAKRKKTAEPAAAKQTARVPEPRPGAQARTDKGVRRDAAMKNGQNPDEPGSQAVSREAAKARKADE